MDKKTKGKSKGFVSDLYFWSQTLVAALVLLITVNTFFLRVNSVMGPSMMATLFEGDQIVLQIAGYHQPQYKDIIVLRTLAKPEEPFVKRVIALAGDVIDIDRKSGDVIVNGATLEETYINEITRTFGNQEFPYTVPEGHVFVMGDNRNRSSDSRDVLVGAIALEDIIGRVVWRVWPLGSIGAVK